MLGRSRYVSKLDTNPVFVTVLDDPHTAFSGRLADFAASLQARLLPSLALVVISHSNDSDKAALQDQHLRWQTFQRLKEGCSFQRCTELVGQFRQRQNCQRRVTARTLWT